MTYAQESARIDADYEAFLAEQAEYFASLGTVCDHGAPTCEHDQCNVVAEEVEA